MGIDSLVSSWRPVAKKHAKEGSLEKVAAALVEYSTFFSYLPFLSREGGTKEGGVCQAGPVLSLPVELSITPWILACVPSKDNPP